jgi:hypothetical protein
MQHYKRHTKRGNFSRSAMLSAVEPVSNCCSIRKFRKFCNNLFILEVHIKKINNLFDG